MGEDWQDFVAAAAMMGMVAAFMVGVVSYVLSFVVGLRSRPERRTLLTMVPSYLIGAMPWAFDTENPVSIYVPLAAIPGAAILYWLWLRHFRRSWYEHAGDVPDGIEVENEDWRGGAIYLCGTLVFAIMYAGIRSSFR